MNELRPRGKFLISLVLFLIIFSISFCEETFIYLENGSNLVNFDVENIGNHKIDRLEAVFAADFAQGVTASEYSWTLNNIDVFDTVTKEITIAVDSSVTNTYFPVEMEYYEGSIQEKKNIRRDNLIFVVGQPFPEIRDFTVLSSVFSPNSDNCNDTIGFSVGIWSAFGITNTKMIIYNSGDIPVYTYDKTYDNSFMIEEVYSWDGTGTSTEGSYYAVLHSTDLNGHALSLSLQLNPFYLTYNDYEYALKSGDSTIDSTNYPILYPFSVPFVETDPKTGAEYDNVAVYYISKNSPTGNTKLFRLNMGGLLAPLFFFAQEILNTGSDISGILPSTVGYAHEYKDFQFSLLFTEGTSLKRLNDLSSDNNYYSISTITNNIFGNYEYDQEGHFIEKNTHNSYLSLKLWTSSNTYNILTGNWYIRNPHTVHAPGKILVFSGIENPTINPDYDGDYKIYGLVNNGDVSGETPTLLFDGDPGVKCLSTKICPKRRIDIGPWWTADKIAFISNYDGPFNVYIIKTKVGGFFEHITDELSSSNIKLIKLTNYNGSEEIIDENTLLTWSEDGLKIFYETEIDKGTYKEYRLNSIDPSGYGEPYKIYSFNSNSQEIDDLRYRFYPFLKTVKPATLPSPDEPRSDLINIAFASHDNSDMTKNKLNFYFLKYTNSCGRTINVPATITEGDVTVSISPNALPTEEDNLIISEVTDFTDIIDPETQLSSTMSAVYDIHLESTISEFNEPIKLEFTYSDSDIEGIDENTINLYTFDEEDQIWIVAQEDSSMITRDIDDNTFIVYLNHLSYYVLSGQPAPSTTNPEIRLLSTTSKYISPNNDSRNDNFSLSTSLNQDGTIYFSVYDLNGNKKFEISSTVTADAIATFTWTGKDFNNNILPDGEYTYELVGVNGDDLRSSMIISKVIIDLTSPVIRIVNIENGELYNYQVFPMYFVTDTNPFTHTATLNGTPFISGTPVTSEGSYTLQVNAEDAAGNQSLEQITFSVDMTPPDTTISFSGGNYFKSGITYILNSTLIQFNSTDGFSGVAKTEYYIDSKPYITYSDPFTLSNPDGNHNLYFRSVDNSGNIENVKTARINLDNTAPMSQLVIGAPVYTDGISTFISGATDLEVFSSDSGSGIASQFYRVDTGTEIQVNDIFYLNKEVEGAHVISYYARDNLNNTESTKTKNIIIDNSAPETQVTFTPFYFENGITVVFTESIVTINASDQGVIPCGVKVTQYKIENSSGFSTGWLNYLEPFNLTDIPIGEYIFSYKSIDYLNNEEEIKTVNIKTNPVLETEVGIFNQDSVLIWLNYKMEFLQENQLINLENIANNFNVPYFEVVNSESEFMNRMRSGVFNIYMILGNWKPLTGHHADELREHVNSGKGLISSQYRHFRSEGSASEVQGVDFLQWFGGQDLIINLDDSPISNAGLLNTKWKSEQVKVLEDSNATGFGLIKVGDEEGPAFILNEYGKGKSVYFAFDLVASCTDSNFTVIKELLTNSIEYVTPINTAIYPEAIVSIYIKMKTTPYSLDLKIVEELPEGFQVLYAAENPVETENNLVWNISIDPDEWKNIYFTVKLPNQVDSYELLTNYYVVMDNFYHYIKTDNLSIDITKTTDEYILEVKENLNNLAVAHNEQHNINNAVKFIEKLDFESDKSNNIQFILKAIEEVRKIESVDVADIIYQLDYLLLIIEAR